MIASRLDPIEWSFHALRGANARHSVRIGLGLILIGAAILKANGLLNPSSPNVGESHRWLLALLLPAELLLGVWLLSGWSEVTARVIALLVFCSFVAYSLTGMIRGTKACDCFGSVLVPPAIALSIDLLAVVALAATWPLPGTWRLLESRARQLAFGFFVCIAAALSAAPAYLSARSPNGSSGPLRIDPATQVFKEAYFEPTLRHQLRVFNSSSLPVEVSRFETSCPCGKVVPPALVIPPNSDAAVSLHIQKDLSQLHRLDHRLATPISLSIVPMSADGRVLSTPWRITGTVKSWASLSATSFSFGEIPLATDDRNTTHQHTATLTLETDRKIQDLSVSVDNSLLTVAAVEKKDSASTDVRKTELHFRLTVPKEPGIFSDWVTISPASDSTPRLPPLRIPVTARIVGNVEASPSTVFVDVNSSRPSHTTLSSRNGEPIVVSNISCEHPDAISVNCFKLTSTGAQYRIAARRAFATANVRFTVHFPNARGHEEQLSVPVIATQGEQ